MRWLLSLSIALVCVLIFGASVPEYFGSDSSAWYLIQNELPLVFFLAAIVACISAFAITVFERMTQIQISLFARIVGLVIFNSLATYFVIFHFVRIISSV